MGQKIFLTLVAVGAMTITVCLAKSGANPVVLTPTALYDKIEKLETKHSKVLKVLLNQSKRISDLEARVSELQGKNVSDGEDQAKPIRKRRTETVMWTQGSTLYTEPVINF